MGATFLVQPDILDHVIKTELKALRSLRLANGDEGLTVLGTVAYTCSRKKKTTEQRWFLFSHKYITLFDIKTVISKEKNGLWERVITHWATESLPLLFVSLLASISK